MLNDILRLSAFDGLDEHLFSKLDSSTPQIFRVQKKLLLEELKELDPSDFFESRYPATEEAFFEGLDEIVEEVKEKAKGYIKKKKRKI